MSNENVLEIKALRSSFFTDKGEVPAVSGVDIVTKGGSQGDETAIARCLSFLKEKINK